MVAAHEVGHYIKINSYDKDEILSIFQKFKKYILFKNNDNKLYKKVFRPLDINDKIILGSIQINSAKDFNELDEKKKGDYYESFKMYMYNMDEIVERMVQLKNYFGMNSEDIFTEEHLKYAKENYLDDFGDRKEMEKQIK